jgi:2-dehydropantoate 2-reductase
VRIAIVGAGAIGGYLGARLSRAGENVTCADRGASLARSGPTGSA